MPSWLEFNYFGILGILTKLFLQIHLHSNSLGDRRLVEFLFSGRTRDTTENKLTWKKFQPYTLAQGLASAPSSIYIYIYIQQLIVIRLGYSPQRFLMFLSWNFFVNHLQVLSQKITCVFHSYFDILLFFFGLKLLSAISVLIFEVSSSSSDLIQLNSEPYPKLKLDWLHKFPFCLFFQLAFNIYFVLHQWMIILMKCRWEWLIEMLVEDR